MNSLDNSSFNKRHSVRTIQIPLGLVGVLMIVILSACSETRVNKTTQGGLAGGALGAGMGAIIGNQSGNAGVGTAIGAAAGTLGGVLIGSALESGDEANRSAGRKLEENESQIKENQKLIDELRKRGADVRSSRRGVVVNLPDILFEFDRANLTPEAVRTVGEISSVIADVKQRTIAVEGHTDSIGTVEYNKRLSLARAGSVAAELSRRGVKSSQLRVDGFGEGRPIATNNSEPGRARNRRVEIIVENR